MSPEEQDEAQAERAFQELVAASPSRAAAFLLEVHAADAAEWLQDLSPEDRHQVFNQLPAEAQAGILEHAEDPLAAAIVSHLPADALREVVEELPTDEAVDVLAAADDRVVADVLDALPDEEAKELRELATHGAETAGGLMTTDFVTVSPEARVGDAVKAVKAEGEDAEDLGVFVVDADERPVGYLSDRALLTHSIHEPVAEVMVEPRIVSAGDDQEEAAIVVTKYGLSALAVVGGEGGLLGVISAEDARDVLAEEATEDVHRLVGTSREHQTRLPVSRRVLQRLPLMAVTVLGGLLSAKILAVILPAPGGAEGGQVEAILRYLPLIVGLAGNVGVQSSTILVRAFATGEVERDRDLEVLGSEVATGALIGLLCGAATLFFAAWLEGTGVPAWYLGFSVGVAIVAAVTWAALLGCVVPMSCRRLGVDPAIVAGPFLICLSDISGVGIYIVVARSLVGLA